MKKVLVIKTNSYGSDGITNVILNYYNAIDKDSVHMDFVAIEQPDKKYVDLFSKNGSKLFVLERNNGVFKYFVSLVKLVKKEKYDIVHIHGNSATIAIETFACMLGHVKVRIAHSHNSSCTHIKADKILRPLFYLTYTDGVACGIDAGKWLFRKRKFFVCNNGVDVEKFKYNEEVRMEYRQKLGITNEHLIGNVAGFVGFKNHDGLIDIFDKICKKRDDCKLVLIGDGPLKSDIEEKVSRLGLDDKVIFTGITNEVEKYIQAMDVFLLPSITEGLPLVLIEAQSSGIPCVISDTIDMSCNITGLVKSAKFGDAKDFVEKIEGTFDYDRQAHCYECMESVAKKGYSIKENAKDLKNLYYSL